MNTPSLIKSYFLAEKSSLNIAQENLKMSREALSEVREGLFNIEYNTKMAIYRTLFEIKDWDFETNQEVDLPKGIQTSFQVIQNCELRISYSEMIKQKCDEIIRKDKPWADLHEINYKTWHPIHTNWADIFFQLQDRYDEVMKEAVDFAELRKKANSRYEEYCLQMVSEVNEYTTEEWKSIMEDYLRIVSVGKYTIGQLTEKELKNKIIDILLWEAR